MKESDIVHENGRVFVLREPKTYNVCISGPTHAISDSAYHRNADGLSIAIARANYLARQDVDAIYAALCRAARKL